MTNFFAIFSSSEKPWSWMILEKKTLTRKRVLPYLLQRSALSWVAGSCKHIKSPISWMLCFLAWRRMEEIGPSCDLHSLCAAETNVQNWIARALLLWNVTQIQWTESKINFCREPNIAHQGMKLCRAILHTLETYQVVATSEFSSSCRWVACDQCRGSSRSDAGRWWPPRSSTPSPSSPPQLDSWNRQFMVDRHEGNVD